MSRTLYDALGHTRDDGDPWTTEAEVPSPFLRALAREGRLRRAAWELADAEFREGAWVEAEPAPATATLRLAAQDDAAATWSYAAGPWVIRATVEPDGGRTLTQEQGPVGATVVLAGQPERYVPLVPGVAAPVPAGVALPEVLGILDAAGRRVALPREEGG